MAEHAPPQATGDLINEIAVAPESAAAPTAQRTYLESLVIVSRVMRDKCWHLLWHFDLFEKVDRVYPETSYYRQWWDVMHPASSMGDHLFVGSAFNAADFKWLKAAGVTHIVNVTESIGDYFPQNFVYLRYPTEDLSQGSLLAAYEHFYRYKTENPEARFLIHCYAGRSRSVSLLIYYFMRRYQWSLEKTLEYVRQQRPNINVNVTFLQEIQGLLAKRELDVTMTS